MMCVCGGGYGCVGGCVNGMNPSIIAKFILVLSMSLTYFCTTEVSGSSGIAFKWKQGASSPNHNQPLKIRRWVSQRSFP